MKGEQTATTTAGQHAVERGTGAAVQRAAETFLKERNGGMPPNLHMASRGVLLRIIKEQAEELKKLKATRETA